MSLFTYVLRRDRMSLEKFLSVFKKFIFIFSNWSKCFVYWLGIGGASYFSGLAVRVYGEHRQLGEKIGRLHREIEALLWREVQSKGGKYYFAIFIVGVCGIYFWFIIFLNIIFTLFRHCGKRKKQLSGSRERTASMRRQKKWFISLRKAWKPRVDVSTMRGRLINDYSTPLIS